MKFTGIIIGVMLLIITGCALTYDDDLSGSDSMRVADSIRTTQNICGKSWMVTGRLDTIDLDTNSHTWRIAWAKRESIYRIHKDLQVFDSSESGILETSLSDIALLWTDTSLQMLDPEHRLLNKRFKIILLEICNTTQALEFTRKNDWF